MDHLVDNLKNPFDEMYIWCKGELYDLQALQDAVEAREGVEKNIKKFEQKKRDLQTDLENVQNGKKSVRTIFKNAGDTNSMVNAIEIVRNLIIKIIHFLQTEKEIDNQQTLLELVTIYLGERIIPSFKREKLTVYTKLIQQFNVIEINNSHQIATFWSSVLNEPIVKNVPK